MWYFRRIPIALGLALATMASQTQAGFVTQTVSTSTGPKSTDFTQALTIHAFNPALGSLESVVISFSDVAIINGTLTNSSVSMRTFSISEDVNFALSFGGSSLLTDELPASKVYQNVSNIAPNNTVFFSPSALSNTTLPTTILTGPLLDAVLGTSDVSFVFSTLTSTTISGGGGNVVDNISTQAQASVTVTYNYINANAVTPEPASLLMTALGGILVASMGSVRHHRRGQVNPVR